MNATTQNLLNLEIPGVHSADQARSRVLQGKFAVAGQKMLLKSRLNDVSIPDISRKANSSVGGFYSRFESKEAFFEFLQMRMLKDHLGFIEQNLDLRLFATATRQMISAAFVDVMIHNFSGPWRGVLREAYASIPEAQKSWEPMFRRGQLVRGIMNALLAPHMADVTDAEDRISFAVQLVFSALNNELMNPNLKFTITNPEFRAYLIEAFDQMISGPGRGTVA
jgi:AcrR family transcriptional regulator